MSVSCECCVLSLRRADQSYRGILLSLRVSERDRDASAMKRPGTLGTVAPWEKIKIIL